MTGYFFSKVLSPTPGWYRGDFHVHTTASDGDYPPSLVTELAGAEGLDFIAITDHNTIAGLSELRKDLDFLVIPGLEITLKEGHFNVFGMDGWHDWMDGVRVNERGISPLATYQTVPDMMHQISAEGLLNSINHPCLHPWEWAFHDTDLHYIHCVEIWNDLYWPDNVHANPQAVALWSQWLNAGHRITAIGGSDYHYPPRPEERKFGERLGYPATFVYAKELSVAGIVDGLRQQRAYVSRGPKVNFEAEINEQIFGIGADVGEQTGKITFTATIFSKLKTVQAQLVKNGQVVAEEQARGDEAKVVSFRDSLDGIYPAWYRLDVSDPDGQVLAITNPIFTGPHRKPKLFMYSDFVKIKS